jgi:hypothetical protein
VSKPSVPSIPSIESRIQEVDTQQQNNDLIITYLQSQLNHQLRERDRLSLELKTLRDVYSSFTKR